MPITASDLALRAEIEDVVVRYATAIDTRDWDLFRSVFTDDAKIDYGPMMAVSTAGKPSPPTCARPTPRPAPASTE